MPRILFFLLAATQAGTLAYMQGAIFFGLLLTLLASAGLFGWFQWDLSRKSKTNLVAVLIGVLALKAFLISRGFFSASGAIGPNAYYVALAQFFVVFQVAHLFLRSPSGDLPSYILLPAILGMLFSAERIASPQEQMVYRLLVLCFGVLTSCYLVTAVKHPANASPIPTRPGRQIGRILVLAILILLTGALAWTGSEMAIALERHSEQMFGWMIGGSLPDRSTAGFSSHPWFESIRHFKQDHGEDIALRIYSSRSPGYMRGRTYPDVSLRRMGGWGGEFPKHSESSTSRRFNGLPPLEEAENLFEMRSDTPDWAQGSGAQAQWLTLDVHPLQQLEDAIFSPLGAALLAARLETVTIDTGGIAQSPTMPAGGGYRLFIPSIDQHEVLSSETLQPYLALPQNVDSRVRQLAESVLQGTKTPREKMEVVANYFRSNYQYEIGVIYEKVPKGADAITYFLLEKLPAHCEYFATGAAVLLRLGGVPCRYVNGFVASEKNRFGGYWVARNRDAHAWVEAYDSETRTWRTVEATPSSGVPSAMDEPAGGFLKDRWDAAKFFMARLWKAFRSGGIKHFLLNTIEGAKRQILQSPGLLLPLLCIILFLLSLIFFMRRKRRKHLVQGNPLDAMAHRLLAEMDRQLKRHGFQRQPTETLHQFALRIQSESGEFDLKPAAEWYHQYARLRYSGKLDRQSIQSMDEARSPLRKRDLRDLSDSSRR